MQGFFEVTLNQEGVLKRTLAYLENGKFISKLWKVECSSLSVVSTSFIRVTNKSRCGVIDFNGNEILPVIYETLILKGNHFLIKYNGKYGLADNTGKIIFECFYDEILETSDKFAVKDFARLEIIKVIQTDKK